MNINELLTPPDHEIAAKEFIFDVNTPVINIDLPPDVDVIATNWSDVLLTELGKQVLDENIDPYLRQELATKLYKLEVASVDRTLVYMAIHSPTIEKIAESLPILRSRWEELGGVAVENLDVDNYPASNEAILGGVFFNTIEDSWSVIVLLVFPDASLNPS